ncbi:hypothetical protein, partial [Sphingobium yanoikuyae]|uniref:hypothetical protein n=1 Tax=Sphingobium yanoikuyae TaxID=13690 RepID=UPI0028A12E7D
GGGVRATVLARPDYLHATVISISPETKLTARTTTLFAVDGVLVLDILCGALFAALVGLMRLPPHPLIKHRRQRERAHTLSICASARI